VIVFDGPLFESLQLRHLLQGFLLNGLSSLFNPFELLQWRQFVIVQVFFPLPDLNLS